MYGPDDGSAGRSVDVGIGVEPIADGVPVLEVEIGGLGPGGRDALGEDPGAIDREDRASAVPATEGDAAVDLPGLDHPVDGVAPVAVGIRCVPRERDAGLVELADIADGAADLARLADQFAGR